MKRIDGTTTFAAGLILFLVPLTAVGTGDEGLDSDKSDVGGNDPVVSADSDADDESRSDPPRYLLRYRFRKGEVIRYRSESIEEQCFRRPLVDLEISVFASELIPTVSLAQQSAENRPPDVAAGPVRTKILDRRSHVCLAAPGRARVPEMSTVRRTDGA